jgi:molybdopterin synthase catalytic subunit/molybdopterin converting factor small subunit
MSIKIKLFFFATIRELVGLDSLVLELPEQMAVRDLKTYLAAQFVQLKNHLDTTLVSIDREFALDDDLVCDGAEIALFPPVSGGSGDFPNFCILTADEIDLDEILTRLTLPTTGAVCFFTGLVRQKTHRKHPHQTLHLEYEAYEEMAIQKLEQVAHEIRDKWPKVEGIAMIQRTGILSPGTPTVVVACTSPHRDDGIFEAACYGIDRLKEIVPVWKKEVSLDHEEWVEGEYIPKPGE